MLCFNKKHRIVSHRVSTTTSIQCTQIQHTHNTHTSTQKMASQLILSVEQSIKNFHANAAIRHGPYDLQTEFQTKPKYGFVACKWCTRHSHSHSHTIQWKHIASVERLCVLISCGDGAATFTHLKITLFLALTRFIDGAFFLLFLSIDACWLACIRCSKHIFNGLSIWKLCALSFDAFQWNKKLHIDRYI